jgi:hypothetical protein
MARALDTLQIFDELKQSFSEEQAQVITKVLKKVYEANLEELATKGDLKELELRLENKLESLKGELTLLKWMIGFIFAGVISLILKAFFA